MPFATVSFSTVSPVLYFKAERGEKIVSNNLKFHHAGLLSAVNVFSTPPSYCGSSTTSTKSVSMLLPVL